jgi:nitrate/nitrite-specific signal transduction histidine kinase
MLELLLPGSRGRCVLRLSEAAADNAEHAHASVVHVDAHIADRRPRLSVRDDGVACPLGV